MSELAVSVGSRVSLAHACVQVLADRCGADVLHIKGPALDPRLRHAHRSDGTDADVVVRPHHLDRLTSLMTAHGWSLVTGFESGSVFTHAANYRHHAFGYADVHRKVPGVELDPGVAFEALWAERQVVSLAEIGCAVPDLVDQGLLLLLHAARGGGGTSAVADHDAAWQRLDPETHDAVRSRADRLQATVGLAAALGELDRHPPARTVPLWRVYSEGGTRLDEYLASIRAAPTWRARVRVAVRRLRLDEQYVAMSLGHTPSAAELRRLRRERWGRAWRALRDRLVR